MFQHKHCEDDKVCKLVELTVCPGCLEGTDPDHCQCSTTYEPECVPANPTRECFEKTFADFRFFLEKGSGIHEKEFPGNIMEYVSGFQNVLHSVAIWIVTWDKLLTSQDVQSVNALIQSPTTARYVEQSLFKLISQIY